MHKTFLMAAIPAALAFSFPVHADDDLSKLRQELDQLKHNYEQKIQALEERIEANEKKSAEQSVTAGAGSQSTQKANSFNPALSLILNGQVASYSASLDDYALPGFALGDEAGPAQEGFSLGESEITLAANTDQYWRGQMTLSLDSGDGETVPSVEEAFIETLGLGNGLTVRAGRFFSGIGYLNGKHAHAWNFTDAPLVYRGLFGNQISQDGLRLSWLPPTDQYIELGAEVGNGQSFPAGGSHSGIGDWAVFAKTGGDIGVSHSWQLGLSHYQADDIDGREAATHSFSGDSKLNGIDLVYKWAPNGNAQDSSLTLQAEYFRRDENGAVSIDDAGSSSLDGNQDGWYAEGLFKFKRHWRAGLRYDRLSSDNSGDNTEILSEAGLLSDGFNPHRTSAMLEWSPSEFSRIRVQYNRDNSRPETDDQGFVQYTQALGSHGAHQY